MIRNFLCLTTGVIILAGCVSVHETRHVTEKKAAAESDRVLRHVLLFKFKDGTSKSGFQQTSLCLFGP
jgi:uncharacterized lipoprotein YajG